MGLRRHLLNVSLRTKDQVPKVLIRILWGDKNKNTSLNPQVGVNTCQSNVTCYNEKGYFKFHRSANF